MKISKIRIHNYRSISDMEMDCEELVVMIGPNNHGKSNIVSAIEFALSTSVKPTQGEFFAFCGDEKSLWVEITFHKLTEQEKNTFKRYTRSNDSICLRKSAKISESETLEVSYNGYIQEPEEWWLKDESVNQLKERSKIGETPLIDLVPASGVLAQTIIREAQTRYITEHRDQLNFREILETSPLLGQKNVAGGVLPDFYLIPAVRDLSDETKIKNTTAFGRLLNRAVREMAERDPRFLELRDGLENLVKSLNKQDELGVERPEQLVILEKNIKDELSYWGVNVEIEVLPPDIEKIFELGTNLHLDDGIKTLAEEKGHGLQRACIFALIRAWANVLHDTPARNVGTTARASSESVIFAMEEPELFLHPHAQRKLASSIRQISDSPDHQVFVCSHSTHFVDLNYYKNICIVNKRTPQEGTKVRQCAIELFEQDTSDDRKKRFHMAHWVNPDRSEMFFARRVAFVEGETEKTLFPYLAQKMGCYDYEVSIIDCGSKHNLILYITVANAFKISFIVIHDEDPLPDPIPADWGDEKKREKQRTFKLNQDILNAIDNSIGRIEMLSPDFEGASGVSKRSGDRKGKALAALNYFEKNSVEAISERLKEIVRAIYCPAEKRDGE